MRIFPRENNFDILRLFAAFQVALYHGYVHLKLKGDNVIFDFFIQKILIYFPGVPIFFSMSGFLIFYSFDKNSRIKDYWKKRLLRLYPGLWASFLVTLLILFGTGFLTGNNIFSVQAIKWILGQLSFFQFYTPDILRSYGLGNPNGSLWTIVVELQYYALVPCLFWLFKRIRLKRNTILMVLFVLSVIINMYLARFSNFGNAYVKIAAISVIPYLFYFLLGALIYTNYHFIYKLIENKAGYAITVYFCFYILVSKILNLYVPDYWVNFYGLINSILLIWTIFAFAFTQRDLSLKLLRGNDVSYGLYIYHGIVLNFFIYKYVDSTFWVLFFYLLTSIGLAFLSWKLIERPVINYKNKHLK